MEGSRQTCGTIKKSVWCDDGKWVNAKRYGDIPVALFFKKVLL